MDYREFTAKTVDDAITEACKALSVTSDRLDYEVVEEGSSGFLGIHAKNAYQGKDQRFFRGQSKGFP